MEIDYMKKKFCQTPAAIQFQQALNFRLNETRDRKEEKASDKNSDIVTEAAIPT